MTSFADTIRGRVCDEHRCVDQALACGDAFDQDIHQAMLDDLYRLALLNGIPPGELEPERSLVPAARAPISTNTSVRYSYTAR